MIEGIDILDVLAPGGSDLIRSGPVGESLLFYTDSDLCFVVKGQGRVCLLTCDWLSAGNVLLAFLLGVLMKLSQ